MVSKGFIDELGARATRQRANLATEEATKIALILPFLQGLGYDVFDPEQVVPEFTAGFGSQAREKVDYAIIRDGTPVMLIECKKVGDRLERDGAKQLGSYFHETPARIGVLTDGVRYRFFSDLDADNVMDERPFLEVDITAADNRDIQALGHFARATFNLDEARSAAANMKHISGMKGYLTQMYSQPDEEFVRLLTRQGASFSGPLFQNRLEHFSGLARLAFHEFVNDLIGDTLRRASDIVNSSASNEPDETNLEGDADDDYGDNSGSRNIVTTAEEIEGYELVKAIVSDAVDAERVFMRDSQNYCSVLLDNNNRRAICRLHFNSPSRKRLSIPSNERTRGGARVSTFHDIESVNDISEYAEQLREAVRERLSEVEG